ncbi:MAG: riboflavin biosynthesis protein RibF [Gammaproteobacteria bacterium RIFCSPHIGHO2_12_FULL_38_11]|nr:MAG: riboflavin biosynthesis protein RibF [Gammaproteobacteria bacterium RIFCSPHIGHO2_12_FULL_38_11]
MQLIRDSSHILPESIVTIGNFDGVHKGHQLLVNRLIDNARELNLPSVLLTFEPNPIEFFSPTHPPARLMRFFEKWHEIKKAGVDYFYCARFNNALSKLSAHEFVKTILVDQLNAKKIIVGDDFRFGAKRLGDVELLRTLGKKYNFTVEAILQLMHDELRISSTRIRNALRQGDFKMVSSLTDRPFTLSGKVAYGNQIGRTLGFPTANIYLRRKAVPMMGIFIVLVNGLNNKILPGVASIGYRPTFEGKQIILEVFLFDFDEIIYGRRITVEFLKKIRDEEKFKSIDQLVIQIRKDVEIAKYYFMCGD